MSEEEEEDHDEVEEQNESQAGLVLTHVEISEPELSSQDGWFSPYLTCVFCLYAFVYHS